LTLRGRKNLQRDVTVELPVGGAVHVAHAEGADLLDDPVVGEGLADHGAGSASLD